MTLDELYLAKGKLVTQVELAQSELERVNKAIMENIAQQMQQMQASANAQAAKAAEEIKQVS